MDIQSLTDNFAIPRVLAFSETEHGLIRAAITMPACTAELYLQGAHLTQWQPTCQKPVLFLSNRSAFTPGKAIRGGVPIIFPWFGARMATPENQHTDGPSHGFARISEWNLVFAAIAGDGLHLTLTLGPDDTNRAIGYDNFQLVYQLTLGTELRLELTVANQTNTSLHFEEALHTYFSVGDAQQISIMGFCDTDYPDKTDEFKRKRQGETLLKLTGETDRAYLDTQATINLDDPVLNRRITVDKANSHTTVVWNPWPDLAAKLPDMASNGWLTMTCIEIANAATNAITLVPGGQHTMEAHISVQKFAPGCSAE